MLGPLESWVELTKPLGGSLKSSSHLQFHDLCDVRFSTFRQEAWGRWYHSATRRNSSWLLFVCTPEPFAHCNFQRASPCSPKAIDDLPKCPSHCWLAETFELILSASPIWLSKEILCLTEWINESVWKYFSVNLNELFINFSRCLIDISRLKVVDRDMPPQKKEKRITINEDTVESRSKETKLPTSGW